MQTTVIVMPYIQIYNKQHSHYDRKLMVLFESAICEISFLTFVEYQQCIDTKYEFPSIT